MSEKVLIIGSRGLLGKKVSDLIKKKSFGVFEVIRPRDNKHLNTIQEIPLNLSDEWDPLALPRDIDILVFLAQSKKFRQFPEEAQDIFNINVRSLFKLLDYGRKIGIKKFVYASSGGVYGYGREAFSENAPLIGPGELGFYLGTKLTGEILVQSYAKNFEVKILRFFFIYGKNQDRSMLIPRLYDSVAKGKPIQLVGANGIRINPVHVDDSASILVKSLEAPGNITCNVAGPDVLSIREICELFGQHLGCSPVFEQVPGVANDLIGNTTLQKEIFNSKMNRIKDKIEDICPPNFREDI